MRRSLGYIAAALLVGCGAQRTELGVADAGGASDAAADAGCAVPCGPNCCAEGQSCDADRGECVEPCTPESDEAICGRLDKQCGTLAATDNCGHERSSVQCGNCTPPDVCNGSNRCECVDGDVQFCAREQRACGPLTGVDGCGQPRAVASCGTCAEHEACGEDGQCACVPETDAELCQAAAKECGSPTLTDRCGVPRAIASCGTCAGPKYCEDDHCTMPPPPANDTCAQPEPLHFVDGVAMAQGSTRFATGDLNILCGVTDGPEVVYSFTLAQRASASFVVAAPEGGSFSPAIILTDRCESPTQALLCSAANAGARATAQTGVLERGTWFVYVDGFNGSSGDFSLLVSLLPAPENDLCAIPTPVSIDPATGLGHATGTTVGAADDITGSCMQGSGRDVYFSVLLPAPGHIEATVTRAPGSSPAISVDVVDGCGTTPVERACATEGLLPGIATAFAQDLPAGTYYVVVDDTSAAGGDFALDVQVMPGPANDACNHAVALAFNATTHSATQSGTTMLSHDDAAGSCVNSPGNDVVYWFTVQGGGYNQNIELDVAPQAGSVLMPVVYVRSACGVASSELGCAGSASATATYLRVRKLTPGNYYVWVDGSSSFTGAFTMTATLSDVIPPPNDLCVAATPLAITTVGDTATALGTTVDATDDSTGACGAMDGPDVAYSFTLPASASVQAIVAPDAATPNWVPAVYIRSACTSSAPGDQKACVTASAAGGSVTARAPNLAAGTYFVVVDGLRHTEGAFSVELRTAPPVTNLDCASALPLAVGASTPSVAVSSDNVFGTNSTSSTCVPGAAAPEVVYSFEVVGVPYDAMIVVTPQPGSQVTLNPSVRSSCATRASEIACAVGRTGQQVPLVLKRLAPGTYYIWIDGVAAADAGPFDLTVTALPSPVIAANDTCAAPAALTIDPATSSVMVTGDTDAATGDIDGSCRVGSGPDLAYSLTLTQPRGVELSVGPSVGSTLRPVVYLRRTCDQATSEAACGVGAAVGQSATATVPWLDVGTYYVVVDSYGHNESGPFELQARLIAPVPVATNDTCASATPLQFDANRKATVTGNTDEGSDNDTSYCATAALPLNGLDLVYSFTLSSATVVTAKVTASSTSPAYRPAVSLRSGCDLSSEVACALDANGTSTATASLAAGTWYVFVDGVGAGANTGFGQFTLDVTQGAAAVAADTCGNPTDLVFNASGVATVNGDLSTATATTSASCKYVGADGNDFVYRMALATPKTVAFVVTGFAAGKRPGVYVRRSCDDLRSEVFCSYFNDLTVKNLAAGTWYVWVDANTTAAANQIAFTLTVTATDPLTPAPANDVCANAQSLALDPVSHAARAYGDTTWAGGEYAGTCGSGSTIQSGPDLVYSVTLTQAATLQATIWRDSTTSSYNPALYLRSNCASSSPLDELACSTESASATASISAALQPGTWYLFVDGQSASAGKFVLDVVAQTPPASTNDTCATAAPLLFDGQGFAAVAGTTAGAANDLSANCLASTAPEVVYSFTTTAAKDVIIDTSPSGALTPLVYLRSSCGTATSERGCAFASSTGPVRLSFKSLPAGTWYIVVDGSGSTAGAFILRVNATDPQSPANDVCGGALALVFDATGKATASGNTMNGADNYSGACASDTVPFDGPDLVYYFTLSSTSAVTASATRAPWAVDYKPAVYLRSTCASNDFAADAGCVATSASSVATTLPAGTWYVIVDGIGGSFGDFTLQVTAQSPGTPGDGCLVAQALSFDTNGVAQVSGDNTTATNSGDLTCANSSGSDLVYSFVVPRLSTVDVHVAPATGSVIRPAISVRSTCSDARVGTDLNCVKALTATAVDLRVPVLPPGTYYLWVDSYSSSYSGAFTGTVTLSTPASAPVNDTCATATPLQLMGSTASATGDTAFATDDSIGSCEVASGPDVVYSLTTTQTYMLTAAVTRDATSPGYQPLVYVRSSCTAPSMSVGDLACAKQTNGGASAVVNSLPPGTYYIFVDGSVLASPNLNSPVPGRFTLNVSLTTPLASPANDSCANAIAIPITGSSAQVTGTSVNAQNDGAGSCASGSGSAPDVVYSITTTAAQMITATVTPTGSYWPAVYIRTACASSLPSQELACKSSTSGAASAVVKSAPAGTYWIWVDGATSAKSGTFTLDVSLQAPVLPPANDTCAGAVALTPGVPVAGDSTNANNDYGDQPLPLACGPASSLKGGVEVVYKYRPLTSGRFVVRTTEQTSSYNMVLWYTVGVCGDGSACRGSANVNGNGIGETLTIDGVAGTDYFFYVDTISSTWPGGQFTIEAD